MFPRSLAAAAAIVSLASFALPSPARSDWNPGGNLIGLFGASYPVYDAMVIDMPGGDLMVIGAGRNSSTSSYVAQRVTTDGVIASGWPANGVSLASVSLTDPNRAQGFFVDDNSLLWHAWTNSSVRLELTSATGVHAPAASPGYYSSGSGNFTTSAVPAPSGDAFVARGSGSVIRVTSAGTQVAIAALRTGFSSEQASLLSDGSGGCYALLRYGSNGGAVLQRFDSDLHVVSGWPASGRSLTTVSNTVGYGNNDLFLAPSGPDHVIAVWWNGSLYNALAPIRMQRVGNDGVVDPAWPVAGLEPSPADTVETLRGLPDGQGGVYILRINSYRPAVTHVSSDGQIIGGPDAVILDANAQYIDYPGGSSVDHPVLADVTPDGGLIVAWNDLRPGGTGFHVRWLNPDLTLKPDTPDEGVVVTPATTDSYHDSPVALHSDGQGGAYLVWGVVTIDLAQNALWMTHVAPPVVTGVGDPGSLASRLALSTPRPNPSRGDVAIELTLPADHEARADLLDLSGRIVRTQAVAGAGRHSIRFDRMESLSPGLYFVRARSGAESSTVRFVLER